MGILIPLYKYYSGKFILVPYEGAFPLARKSFLLQNYSQSVFVETIPVVKAFCERICDTGLALYSVEKGAVLVGDRGGVVGT